MKALLILGMHRSGTSALAEQCAAMGVWFGDNLLPPKPDNPKGFYEDRDIMLANDRLATLLFGSWHSPIAWRDAEQSFPLDHPRITEIQDTLRERLRRLADNGRVVGVKDPRLSRLLPVWWPVVRSLEIDVGLVMAVRRPTEVVASLEQRDCLGGATSRLLWLRHVAESLAYALQQELRIAIAPYHQLIDTPELLTERLRLIGFQPEQNSTTFADGALRHHAEAGVHDGPIAQACDRLYQAIVPIPVFGRDTLPEGAAQIIKEACDLRLDGHLNLLYREAMGVSSERQRLFREQRMRGKPRAVSASHPLSTQGEAQAGITSDTPCVERRDVLHVDGAAGGSPGPTKLTLCCVIDNKPRFYVELVLWAICAKRQLPSDRFQIVVYFVNTAPHDLVDWVKAQEIEVRHVGSAIAGSDHCNKIAPFLDARGTECTIVCDADLFFVGDPACLLTSSRFRAPPNNHCNPPPRIFQAILAASGLGRAYRPGVALYKDASGLRETHINNISGGFVAAPGHRSQEFAQLWMKWARWLIEHRDLMERWAIHVDQVAFALAMEELQEDVEFLPPQINAILHILEDLASVYAFHLTSAHIPQFPQRFNLDRTLKVDGVADGVADAIDRLNGCIRKAVEIINHLPSTKQHTEKFLNPHWRR